MKTVRVHNFGEVTDPATFLRSRGDRLIGYLIRGQWDDDYLLCIATKNKAAYYGDESLRGQSALLVWNPGSEQAYVSFDGNEAAIRNALVRLQICLGLNMYERKELIGHDGPSAGLEAHISRLVADLPPAFKSCRIDGVSVNVLDAKGVIRNIVARFRRRRQMKVRVMDEEGKLAWNTTTKRLLASMADIDPEGVLLLDTGDGHENPVCRISPMKSRSSGKYVVGVWFDSMLEYSEDE